MTQRFIGLVLATALRGQDFDLVLKGGHVLDPGNGIDGVMDVAVSGKKIAAVGKGLSGKKTIDVSGRYVTPGLIDLHTHVYLKGRSSTVVADQTVLPYGTTTIVDAGVSGWKTFDDFKATVIDRSRVRILALVNIVGGGMSDNIQKEFNVADMDPRAAADKVKQYPGLIVGIKTAHFGLPGWAAVERAIEAGRLANVPVMLDSHIYSNSGRDTRRKVLEMMRPGDIHTHSYNDQQLELIDRFSGKVQPWMIEARKRGVLFDLGHGGGSFLWPVARAAISQGFPVDTISTDLHPGSVLSLKVNMADCISKLMSLGMPLGDAVRRATVNPAKAIRKYPELGTLSVGGVADIAVWQVREGAFAFVDSQRKKLTGTKKLICVLTMRDGNVLFERPAEPDRAVTLYDIVLRNGHVVDPASGRDGRFDIGIKGGKIARVAERIRSEQGLMVLDAGDYFVTPGLIDARASVDFLGSEKGLQPDQFCLPHGVTTVIDGSAGREVVRRSRTRVMGGQAPQDALRTDADRTNPVTMTAVMEKLMASGLTFAKVVERGTAVPAKALLLRDVGSLREGAAADLALFDVQGNRVVCVLTMRNGDAVWDLQGLTLREWTQAGAYSNYR
ncbi:MAG TPA: amidohydrolase family protein [Bryobacteraceae bacterium]|nr:amidohydrolase family protein [Bryobacteraceae bacterium]